MSFNFHRLPQSLRPRALRETNQNSLVFAKNSPQKSRKARRVHCISERHKYLAKRMIIKQFELTSAPGKYKLTVRNHQKLLRYC